jgi:hypothetical protein
MCEEKCELWEFGKMEFKKGSFNYETSRPYRLWYEYLRLSPTYLLAHKKNTDYEGGLTEDEKKSLPSDFNEVLKTYNDFGDIYQQSFREWWTGRLKDGDIFNKSKSTLFGFQSFKTQAMALTLVQEDQEINEEYYMQALKGYLNSKHRIQNDPSFMVIAVPLIGTRSDILNAVNNLIDEDDIRPLRPSYSLSGDRFHHDSLSTGLRVLYNRAKFPKLALWKIGVLSGVSKKYAHLDINEKPNHKTIEETEKLAILTSAMLKNSIAIMENAARGKFPCRDKVSNIKLDYPYLWQQITENYKLNQNNLKKIFDQILVGKYSGVNTIHWTDDLIAIDPEHKTQVDNFKADNRKFFRKRQLLIHPKKKQ